jgi:D-aminopeptidase
MPGGYIPAVPPPPPRPRARDLGLTFGSLETGALNAITDVSGVRVGHVTHWDDDPDGVARTGVTAIVPDSLDAIYQRPMAAGPAVLNGCGELTGSIAMAEWGTLEGPIMLTGTSSIGRVFDAVVDAVFAAVPRTDPDEEVVPVPVVGECDDSWLDEARRRHVTVADGRAAIDGAAGGPVSEGVVGAGTGMMTMELKAGIGTSSRVIADLGTVGVLVLANFGLLRQLRVAGVPVGVTLAADAAATRGDAGSCIGVVATDIPLDARQLTRVARRVGLGLARVGSVAGHGSGDIFCAFSTTNRRPRVAEGIHSVDLLGDDSIGAVFAATVDATEEAVMNALFVADTVIGRDGHVAPGLPVDRVLAVLGR